MKVEIEICDICGAQHDVRRQLQWCSIYTPVNSGWSYDGQNLPHPINSVCRGCREVVTDAINKAIELRRGLIYFPPDRKQLVDPDNF